MRRYILAMALMSALISCNKEGNPDGAGEIIVTAKVNELTKAGYEGSTSLPDAFVMNIDQAVDRYDYSLVEMIKSESGNGYTSNESLLWASDNHDDVVVKAMTIPYGLSTVDEINPMVVSVSLEQSDEDNVAASDLLVASTGNGVEVIEDKITVNFSHVMAKLLVSYEFSAEFRDVTVNSLALKNICTAGGYSYYNMDYDSSISLDYGDVAMYHNVSDKTAEAIFYPYAPTESPVLTLNATISGVTHEFTCPVTPNDVTTGFAGGKCYRLNVAVVSSATGGISASITSGWDTSTEDKDFVTE